MIVTDLIIMGVVQLCTGIMVSGEIRSNLSSDTPLLFLMKWGFYSSCITPDIIQNGYYKQNKNIQFRQEGFQESSHAEYSVDAFNSLNPDVIFIVGHFAPPIDEFLRTCSDLNIRCKTLSDESVYTLNDEYITGPLGLIIGLMDITNLLHPELFSYSLNDERTKLDRLCIGNSPLNAM